MRTLLLIIAAMLIDVAAFGQTIFNFDNPDFSSKPGFLHVTKDSSVYMTGLSNNDFLFGSAAAYRSTMNDSFVIERTDPLPSFWGEFPFELSVFGLNKR